jgi:hypothetical protein
VIYEKAEKTPLQKQIDQIILDDEIEAQNDYMLKN